MKKTLLLVFIHGFQGGDDTFARFPPHLRALLSHALPHLNILQIQYPKFETRGDLGECVANFKEWLQNKVIDLEVANKTPSPTISPGVRVIIIGHSMGGIVGAETILSIYRDKPIPPQSTTIADTPSEEESLPLPASTWPSIIGLLAFDTPYLGISPGVLAHNAESHIQTVRGAWNTYSSVAGALGLGGAASSAEEREAKEDFKPASPPSINDPDPSAQPAWQRWGRYAMYAGAAGAIIAGGAAAYANRAQISEGWGWATSHLEFVGCLARKAQLEARVRELVRLAGGNEVSNPKQAEKAGEEARLGWANLYTQLGSGAGVLKWNDDGTPGQSSSATGWAHVVVGNDRTFCMLPVKSGPVAAASQFWEHTVNDKQGNEISAHMHMFTPKDNPGYYGMSERAKEKIVEWVRRGWILDESVEDDAKQGADKDLEDSVIVEKDDLIDL